MHFGAGEWDFRLLPHSHFEIPDKFGSVEFSLPLFVGKIGVNLMVNLVPLCDDGVCEIWAPSDNVNIILFLAGDSFAKVIQVAITELGLSRFERVHFIPLKSFAIEVAPECAEFLPLFEVKEPMLVGVVVVFSSLADREMRLFRIDPCGELARY